MTITANKGCVFMCFGGKHNAHQIVAFHTLRKHWAGRVAIMTDEKNEAAMRKLADDGTQVIKFNAFGRRSHGNGAGYLNKTKLIDMMPFMHSVFIDSDCLVVGDIAKMFPADVEVRLTQFSDWVTTGNKMSTRIKKWQKAMPDQVALQMAVSYPAINTGVMGLSKLSKKLSRHWHETTLKNVSFMCDELAMQLIFLQHPHVVLPDYFNCSVIYSPQRAHFDESKVRIWHGHGFKTIRSAKGLSLWLPELLELWQNDVYGIKDAFAANKYFRRLQADPVEFVKQYAKEQADAIIDANNINEESFA